ncbi:hypothetical protein SD71_02660 [Cohnella kolymensis]|uniref:Uncharacterized protein n=1 Tax=Cohnella kolymensis TaxID=1590652 RepID=A0ABR5AAA6_9BACL|nr:hypothetical protein [Cohnella kolymensis]KIL37540.1 hypothetical protein SD71_02660 [Cohnella kolymensis]
MRLNSKPLFSKTRFYTLWIVLFALIMIMIFSHYYVFHGMSVNPDVIVINTSKPENGGFVLNGDTTSSAAGFSGYSYEVDNGNLLLNVRYIPLANRWHPFGDFRIQLSKQEMADVSQIYLSSEDGRKKLVWTKTA